MKRQLLSLKFLQTTLLLSLLATRECFSAQPAAEVPKAYVPLHRQEVHNLRPASRRRENITVVSFFWSNLLFSYLDYTPELERVPYADLTSRLNQAAYKNMLARKYSDVGDFLRQQGTGISAAVGTDR